MNNLQEFIQAVQRQGELQIVDCLVDPKLEMAEIHRRVIAANGPALLFTKVKGSNFPVVTNLYGTEKRVELAFGKKNLDLIASLAAMPETMVPPDFFKVWKERKTFLQLLRTRFSKTRRAPVMAHQISNADLTQLPALTCWEKDGGPFLTLPLVETTGSTKLGKSNNLGMYRVQIFDQRHGGCHFQISKGAGFHLQVQEQKGLSLPVSIYLGGPPVMTLAAIAPLPENLPELLFASLLLGRSLKRQTVSPNRWVVAEAEFAILGQIQPNQRRDEGPFGDHYGYYSLCHPYPFFITETIYHRKGAVYPATVVGKPRQEDYYIGNFLQNLLSPLFPVVMPGVLDLWSYGETGYHALTAARIKERYPRESVVSAFRILGEGQLSLTKVLFCIDGTFDVKDFKRVLVYLLKRVNFDQDLYVFSDLSMDTLDYTGPAVNKGSKLVLLGFGMEIRQLEDEWKGLDHDAVKRSRAFAPGCLVLEPKDRLKSFEGHEDLGAHLAQFEGYQGWPLLILVDDLEKAIKSEAAFLWTVFTRFEPAGDVHMAAQKIKRHRLTYQGPMLIDARMKPWYPEELFCDPKTKDLVDQRWHEYFPHGKVEMGSSDDAHLG